MTTALEEGEGSASRPGRSLPPGKTRYPLYRRLGGPQGRSGQVWKISPPTGIRSPDRPARSQSLYQLRYSPNPPSEPCRIVQLADIQQISQTILCPSQGLSFNTTNPDNTQTRIEVRNRNSNTAAEASSSLNPLNAKLNPSAICWHY